MSAKIETEADYDTALKRVEEIWNAEAGTPEGEELDKLVDMIEEYEAVHYTILGPASPTADVLVDAIDADNLHKEITTGKSVGREFLPVEEDLLEGMTFYTAHGDEVPELSSKELGEPDDDN